MRRPLIPKRAVLVFNTFLLSVLLYIDRICISVAKDPISQDLGFTATQMGWVLSAFALGYALFQTPSGHLADRLGPRKVLTAVVTFWSVFTALTGAVVNFVRCLLSAFCSVPAISASFIMMPGIESLTQSLQREQCRESALYFWRDGARGRKGHHSALCGRHDHHSTFGTPRDTASLYS